MLQYNNNNFDEVFYNNERDNLDKMAREINNNKKYMLKNVSKEISNNEKMSLKGIEAFSNEPNFNFSPQTNLYDKNGNYKSDFISGLPTPLDEQSYNNSDILTLKSSNKYSDNIENFDDISSEYTYLPTKKKKHLRLNNDHLKKYSENDENLILNHIQNCKECKYHLINILKNENHLFENTKLINNKKEEIIKEEKIYGLNYKELKDIIILIIIGIIIIFILDIFLRR